MNEKITESVRKKVLEIMELAMLINDSPTQQEYIGNKPTVFVEYSGHLANLYAHFAPMGWFDEITEDEMVFYRFNLTGNENAEAELDDFIEKLKVILADDTPYSLQHTASSRQIEKEGNDNEQ